MRIGSAEQESTFLSQALALRRILEREGVGGPIEILTSPAASMDNANRLHAGELDFGFMAANWIGRAKRGLPPFRAAVDLRMTAPMNAGPLYFIALPDSGLRSVHDLRGRRVAIGAKTSGMAQHAACIFEALGWGASEVDRRSLDFFEGADALLRGDVDAQLQCPPPNKVMRDLTARTAVTVLSWPPQELDRVLRAWPVYRRTIMRAGTLRGLDRDSEQPAVLNVLVTHARVDDEMVCEAARSIARRAGELEQIEPLYCGLSALLEPLRAKGPAAFEVEGVPLHPGAVHGYRQAGLLT